MMLKVAPTAALLLKKPEVAPTLGVAPAEMVEPDSVGGEPYDVRVAGLLINVVVGFFALLDVTPTVELNIVKNLYEDFAKSRETYLTTPSEEDAWAFKEEEDDSEGVDDGEAVAEAALVLGKVDAARDGEGADDEVSSTGVGCEEGVGEGVGVGEETGAGLDASVFASGVEGADCEGAGSDWGELDSEATLVALAWWRARWW